MFSGNGKTPQNTFIEVPSNAKIGLTRARIAMQWNTSGSSCGAFLYGEVEDYSVMVTGCQENMELTCDDRDPCTINDRYDANCNCIGTFQDSDRDGVCDIEDICPNDPDNNCMNEVEYCALTSSNGSNFEYIEQVVFGEMNNASGNDDGYGDYTRLVVNVANGTTIPIVLTPGFSQKPYPEYWTVWIDYNQDGDFDDREERVWEIKSDTQEEGRITIPNTAKEGVTGMRIAMQWNTQASSACGEITYGEVEDYSVNIQSNGSLDSPVATGRQSSSGFSVTTSSLSISLYPNPVKDILTIQSEQFVEGDQIKIYNNHGYLIHQQILTQGESKIEYLTSDLPAGMYNVLLITKEKKQPLVERFVKI